jgi:carbonic anhydrase
MGNLIRDIVEQLKQLLTYPCIKEKYSAGTINLPDWHYIIETGEIFGYKKVNGGFESVTA